MIGFEELELFYTHPRVRIVQGKQKKSYFTYHRVPWERYPVSIREDTKNPNSISEMTELSIYADDFQRYLDEHPDTFVKLQLPTILSEVIQHIIKCNSGNNDFVFKLSNHIQEFNLFTIIKKKEIFDRHFRNIVEEEKNYINKVDIDRAKRSIEEQYGSGITDDMGCYELFNSVHVHKDKDRDKEPFSNEQEDTLRRIKLYKHFHIIALPMSSNNASITQFIKVGKLLWGT